ncbi:hypothetical protein V1358_09055 [Pseudoalteromonas sp. YIC-656]|uniref:hypothetical protein n=1 Tax=Pseudoalteromonas pernae TaxID=3118054 RepID=UPI0032427547
MNRREALKAISILIGGAITPSAHARLFTQQSDTPLGYEVLNKAQIALVVQMSDLILALDEHQKPIFNLVAFVDLMLAHTVALEERTVCLQGGDLIIAKSNHACTLEDILRALFDIDARQLQHILAVQELPLPEVEEAHKKSYLMYKFIFTVREFLLLGYFTAQQN